MQLKAMLKRFLSFWFNKNQTVKSIDSEATSSRWVPVFVCYQADNEVDDVFESGIHRCPRLHNSPVFTCANQATTHSKYLEQGSSVLKIMVPECRIYALGDHLKLRTITILPSTIAGYYHLAANQKNFIKNPNFDQNTFETN